VSPLYLPRLLQPIVGALRAGPLAVALALPAALAAPALPIGMVNAQTGPASGLGQELRDGAQAVFEEVNARGGVHGRRIELLVADDGYEPERTADAVERLLRGVGGTPVIGFVGFVGTPTSNAALPLVVTHGVPVVGLFTGAMSLRAPAAHALFNVRASYDEETEALVAQLVAEGARSIAVIHQADSFGQAVLDGTERALAHRGLKLAAAAVFSRNSLAVQKAVNTMAAHLPDAIVVAAPYAPMAGIAAALDRAGVESALATVSFVGTEPLLRLAGGTKSLEGLLISQVVPAPAGDATAVGRDCRRLLQTRAGKPLGHVSFEGCIAAKVMVEGLRRAGADPTPQRLLRALQSVERHDLGGLEVDFSRSARQGLGGVFMSRIRQGRVVDLGAVTVTATHFKRKEAP
jgi:branched-chain amino acid transport system substrate-binding protein